MKCIFIAPFLVWAQSASHHYYPGRRVLSIDHSTSWEAYSASCHFTGAWTLTFYNILHTVCSQVPLLHLGGVSKIGVKCLFQGHKTEILSPGWCYLWRCYAFTRHFHLAELKWPEISLSTKKGTRDKTNWKRMVIQLVVLRTKSYDCTCSCLLKCYVLVLFSLLGFVGSWHRITILFPDSWKLYMASLRNNHKQILGKWNQPPWRSG